MTRRAIPLFQFYVIEDKLSCQLYQRSADAFGSAVQYRFVCAVYHDDSTSL